MHPYIRIPMHRLSSSLKYTLLAYLRHDSCHGRRFNGGAKLLCMGRKIANICDLQFLQFLFCVPYKLQPLTAQLQYSALIPNAIIQVCFDITKHCNKTMVL